MIWDYVKPKTGIRSKSRKSLARLTQDRQQNLDNPKSRRSTLVFAYIEKPRFKGWKILN
uniref:Uncharacterized protein n=1 Tax=Rhizophagus irregularis (strain DAOM 181602 / DAOM 197198 / MUCL 43194) TaxID=747089 RepID=U9SZ16_RHIID